MKLVRIAAKISFEEIGRRLEEFEREFETFSETNSNPVDDAIQKLKAREGKNAPDEMTIMLLAELHKKIDELTKIVKGEVREFVPLQNNTVLDFAWFETIRIEGIEPGEKYYGRVDIPLFRQRLIPIFFEGVEPGIAKITKIWPKDKVDFDGYLASKDREEIAREKAL